MTKVNYKSDFDAILRIKDCSGEDLEWPTFDWYAKLYTIQYGRDNKANMYVASCVGGVCTNCFNDNGYIHIVVDNHHLGIGTLAVEFVAKIPDAKYPDEHHRIVTPQALDIELVTGKGDCAPVFEAVITVPVHGGMTKAEIEGLLAAGGYTRELTFGFSNRDAEDWSADHPGVWFNRTAGAFYRDGALAEAGDGCYNEVAEDGTVRANTRMVFRCNDTRYRFAGRELVNLDWATGDAPRRVFRVPSLNAHPGLFYIDRGYISVHASEPCRISLKGLYWHEDGSGYYEGIPLSEFSVSCGRFCKAHIEGDELVVEEGATGGKEYWIHLCLPQRESIQIPPTVIGVRIRPDGSKVFYRCPSTNMSLHVLPPPSDENFLLELLQTYVSPRGKHAKEIRSRDLHQRNRAQYEVWQRSRPRVGGSVLDKYKRVWRWKKLTLCRKFDKDGNLSHKIVRGNHALFRIRIRHCGVWSEWGYFHVDFLGEGKVKVRRSQPLHRAGGRPHPLDEEDIDAMFKR